MASQDGPYTYKVDEQVQGRYLATWSQHEEDPGVMFTAIVTKVDDEGKITAVKIKEIQYKPEDYSKLRKNGVERFTEGSLLNSDDGFFCEIRFVKQN